MKVTSKLKEKIEDCKDVYLIVQYAKWCYRTEKWTGRFIKDINGIYIPEVWYYDDHNGTFEEYRKEPITHITTGNIYDWTFYKNVANRTVEILNRG